MKKLVFCQAIWLNVKYNTNVLELWILLVNYVPKVLNVHMNKIYNKLTTIKSNKFKFEKIFEKITFYFSKVNFSLLEKKIFLKKVDFFLFSFTWTFRTSGTLVNSQHFVVVIEMAWKRT